LTRPFAPGRLALGVVAAGSLACSRADLFPITGQPPALAGGVGGAAVAGAAGGRDGSGGAGDSAGEDGSCPPNIIPQGDTTRMLNVDGTARSYVLHVPPAYAGVSAVPLVVDFHGIGQSGAKERASSPYPAALDALGAIMAFPDGLKGPAGTAWNVGPCCVANVDDVAFARALVDDVRGVACIDSTRVYAVGILTGGGMAHYLACHAADVFAAVAPAAFDLLAENVDDCVPSRPISVISFRGTADARVPYDGGPSSLVPGMPLTFLGAENTFETWAALDHCTGAASTPDANGCSTFSGCDDGVEVTLCTKQGGGEDPGDPSVAWPVLSAHPL